jgi:hypothetical protein
MVRLPVRRGCLRAISRPTGAYRPRGDFKKARPPERISFHEDFGWLSTDGTCIQRISARRLPAPWHRRRSSSWLSTTRARWEAPNARSSRFLLYCRRIVGMPVGATRVARNDVPVSGCCGQPACAERRVGANDSQSESAADPYTGLYGDREPRANATYRAVATAHPDHCRERRMACRCFPAARDHDHGPYRRLGARRQREYGGAHR